MEDYFTLTVPWVPAPFATEWHPSTNEGPFAILTRGNFKTREAAITWGKTHLGGAPYTVTLITDNPIARRAPTVEDFDVWMLEVHDSGLLDEIGDDYNWNAIALGFLVARGVDPKYLANNGWEFLASYNCGDRTRMLAALAEIK